MNGIERCSRYAFGPNRLHYCGPDQNREIQSYIEAEASDQGLVSLLSQFETMFPYLRHIAEANGIRDPLDARVVEAYWLGNLLLDAVPKQSFYSHIRDTLRVKDKLGEKTFSLVAEKIGEGALPFHAFHVFDIWKRTKEGEKETTLLDMDECRVSSGKIIRIEGPFVTVMTEPLVLENGKLALGAPKMKKLIRAIESTYDIGQLKEGDEVSIHWSVICEQITPRQAANLRKYTQKHIEIANETM